MVLDNISMIRAICHRHKTLTDPLPLCTIKSIGGTLFCTQHANLVARQHQNGTLAKY